ncbi:MAG: hypothetical protein MK171_02640 [Pirellulales bacterium]|nr:hypothetical protein [Pirellulales bacterium]
MKFDMQRACGSCSPQTLLCFEPVLANCYQSRTTFFWLWLAFLLDLLCRQLLCPALGHQYLHFSKLQKDLIWGRTLSLVASDTSLKLCPDIEVINHGMDPFKGFGASWFSVDIACQGWLAGMTTFQGFMVTVYRKC